MRAFFDYVNTDALRSFGLGKRDAQHEYVVHLPHAGELMFGRTLIGSLLITLLLPVSNAAQGEQVVVGDKKRCDNARSCKLVIQNQEQCYKALAAVEIQLYERVKAKTLDEEQIDALNLLLDGADQACNEGAVKKAKSKIRSVIEIVLSSPTEKVD